MHIRALAALAALSLLAGCASRPEVGALADNMAVAPDATDHSIMVATSRARDPRPGTYFNGERSTAFDLAEFTVSVPPNHKHGEVELPQSGAGNPQTDFVVRDGGYIENEKAFVAQLNRRLAQKPRGQRSIIIFIHGYNTLFAEGLYRFAQVVHDSKSTAVPVHFSWASRGQLSDYVYDNNSATAARDRLERLFRLALASNAEKVNVLAHSMGNWVTIEALRQMSIRNRGIPTKIRNVMLAAPDVDVDVFRRQVRVIYEGKTRPDFTVFVSRDDDALAASRLLWGSTDRVGAIDPNAEPYRSKLAEAAIRVVDLTDVKTGDPIGHAKFAESPDVVKMIGARLASGQTLSDSKAGIGERLSTVAIGAANVVGRTAGVAVSAPFAIIDGRTREGLADQFDELGASASGVVGSAARVPLSR